MFGHPIRYCFKAEVMVGSFKTFSKSCLLFVKILYLATQKTFFGTSSKLKRSESFFLGAKSFVLENTPVDSWDRPSLHLEEELQKICRLGDCCIPPSLPTDFTYVAEE